MKKIQVKDILGSERLKEYLIKGIKAFISCKGILDNCHRW